MDEQWYWQVFCADLPNANCCDSCHEDEGFGYDLFDVGDFYVCCWVSSMLEDACKETRRG